MPKKRNVQTSDAQKSIIQGVKKSGVKKTAVKKIAVETEKQPVHDETTITGVAIVQHGAWKFILALLIVTALLIVFAIIFVRHEQSQTVIPYNGFEFTEKTSGNKTVWLTRIEVNGRVYDIPFYYLPTEVEDVLFEPGIADAISQAAIRPELVYITLDPDGGSRPVVGAVEISRLLGDRYHLLNLNVKATLKGPSLDGSDTLNNSLPYITCANATDGLLVVQYEQSSMNRVWHEGNCIRVAYETPEDSIRVSDRFAYELLSIM